MRIKINIALSDINDADLDNSESLNDDILVYSIEAAGEAMLALNERRWRRFIRYCHTGRFD